jgi:hypothetical protein
MKKHKNNRNELLSLLQNFSNLRSSQDQVLWSIFGAFWGTNALLLISIFSVDSSWTIAQVGTVISIIGLIISFIWIIIQTRTLDRIQMYENSIMYIERKLKLAKELFAFSKVPKPSINFKVKARYVMRLNCYLLIISWFVALIYFVLICKN